MYVVQAHARTHTLELLNFLFSLQIAKFLKEGISRGKLGWLQKMQQAEQLFNAVLQGSACQQDSVLLEREGGRGGGREGDVSKREGEGGREE